LMACKNIVIGTVSDKGVIGVHTVPPQGRL
jgi:hypothetical protein